MALTIIGAIYLLIMAVALYDIIKPLPMANYGVIFVIIVAVIRHYLGYTL
jgi:hypothetical protein